jgi:hypothetical protein
MLQDPRVVQPTALQPSTVVQPTGVVYGTACGFSWAGATKSDPNNLETAALTESNGRQVITAGSPGTASPLPDAALTYTIPILDLWGRTTTLAWISINRWVLMTFGAPGALVDQVLMIGLSAGGPPTAGRRGVAVSIVPSAGNWLVQRTANPTGAGWSAWTPAAATNATTRGVEGTVATGSGSGGFMLSASALTAAGATIFANVQAVSPTLAGGTVTPGLTHFFIGLGWATGVGGTAGGYTLSGRLGCAMITQVPNLVPT